MPIQKNNSYFYNQLNNICITLLEINLIYENKITFFINIHFLRTLFTQLKITIL